MKITHYNRGNYYHCIIYGSDRKGIIVGSRSLGIALMKGILKYFIYRISLKLRFES